LKTDTANDQLCIACHQGPPPASASVAATAVDPPRTFTGGAEWSRSAHANAATPPGLTRTSASGGCANCHNPHGVRDAAGLIPARLRAREPYVCLNCHDNHASGDVASQLARPYIHGRLAPGAHDPEEGGDARQFAATPLNRRHVSCSDCHNSHGADQGRVAYVEAINGAAGTVPSYSWHAADDPQPARQFEICFKCHSSWTKQPAGQPDLALLINPNNPSFHPIQSRGRDARIDAASFVAGVTADVTISCGDCHGSDDPSVRGPHGSSNRWLLARPPDDLCLTCHARTVYAASDAPAEAQRASRFNAPAAAGHAFHSGARQIACLACHDPHGSTRYPALLARRAPGLISYAQTGSGGTCLSTCHEPRSYSVNYPR
jgi:predicted CXXCH cytochrome family protein